MIIVLDSEEPETGFETYSMLRVPKDAPMLS
jgi:hypothetical protein